MRWGPASVTRAVPSVLREPAFRLLFASQVLSVIGDGVTMIALPFAVLAVGGGVAEVALVSAAQFLPVLLVALPAGVWADRLDRRRILLASDAVRLLAQGTAAVLLLTGTASVAALAVVAAVSGAAGACFAPAFTGLLPSTVTPSRIQDANALRGLTSSLGNIAGPVIAGGLIAFAGGPGVAIAVDAATFAASVALLVPLGRRLTAMLEQTAEDLTGEPAPDVEHPPFLVSLREGAREVRSRPWVMAMLGGFTVYHAVALPAIFVIGPVLMDLRYDGARSWALITALFGIGNVLGDVLLLRWRPPHALRVAAAMLVGASCQAAIIGSHLPVWGIGGLELLTGVCVTGAFTLWETSLGEHIPPRALSRVSSYDYLATVGVIPLGNVVAGTVAAVAGLTPTLVGMSVISIGAALVVLGVPAVRQLPRVAPLLAPRDEPLTQSSS